jgi:PIN domain nuclease of toxin-antitoxin system
MTPRLLLDTHVVVRWLMDSKRLARPQWKALEFAVKRREPVALSAISLLEISVMVSDGRLKLKRGLAELFADLEANPVFQVVPLSYAIALEAGSLSMLRDPADRTVVATARTHRLQLVTSDQRIIESKLVAVID